MIGTPLGKHFVNTSTVHMQAPTKQEGKRRGPC